MAGFRDRDGAGVGEPVFDHPTDDLGREQWRVLSVHDEGGAGDSLEVVPDSRVLLCGPGLAIEAGAGLGGASGFPAQEADVEPRSVAAVIGRAQRVLGQCCAGCRIQPRIELSEDCSVGGDALEARREQAEAGGGSPATAGCDVGARVGQDEPVGAIRVATGETQAGVPALRVADQCDAFELQLLDDRFDVPSDRGVVIAELRVGRRIAVAAAVQCEDAIVVRQVRNQRVPQAGVVTIAVYEEQRQPIEASAITKSTA